MRRGDRRQLFFKSPNAILIYLPKKQYIEKRLLTPRSSEKIREGTKTTFRISFQKLFESKVFLKLNTSLNKIFIMTYLID